LVLFRKDAVVPSKNNHHATDDTLELFALGRLGAAELEELEQHLLVCSACQESLAASDAYVLTIKSAAVELERQPRAVAESWFHKLFDQPNPAWACGLVGVGLLIAASHEWTSRQHASAPPALVCLRTTRGVENSAITAVPAGKPLILMLDLTGLPTLSQYRLEIVDADGDQAFLTHGAPEDNNLRATVAKGLPGGWYYVRVYGSLELLREYGLKVR
jgi:hypothetical protein